MHIAVQLTPRGHLQFGTEPDTPSLPDALAFETLCLDAPPMAGAEYLTPEIFLVLWVEIEVAVKTELAACNRPLQDFLKSKHPAWNLVGRVHFTRTPKPGLAPGFFMPASMLV